MSSMASQKGPAEERPGQPGAGEGHEGLRLLVTLLVGLEAVTLLIGAGVLVAEASDSPEPVSSIAFAVVVALVGLALAGCARGVQQGARWTRGPVLTWQLLQAGVGMPVSASRYWYFGIPILALAVVVGVLIAGKYVLSPEPEQPA